MPLPTFISAEVWCEAVDHAIKRAPNSDALVRHRVSSDIVRRIAETEAAAADVDGISELSASAVGMAVGVPVRTVRLIRAALCNSGLMTIVTLEPSSIQLQQPRGFTGDRSPLEDEHLDS